MFYADKEERATGRQTAFMDFVGRLREGETVPSTEINNPLFAILNMLYRRQVGRNVNGPELFWISALDR